MKILINKLKRDNPSLIFVEGVAACWSPKDQRIFFQKDPQIPDIYALFHELGHARLKHATYTHDLDLLLKEISAWEEAKKIAQQYQIEISPDHIEDCLDTYREWVHRRSTCVACGAHGVQKNKTRYFCLNCSDSWRVTASRFCRVYRVSKQKTRTI